MRIIIATLLTLFSQNSFGCQCPSDYFDQKYAYAKASHAVLARVESNDKKGIVLSTTKKLKGDVNGKFRLLEPAGNSCDAETDHLAPGKTYLLTFFEIKKKSKMLTAKLDLCSLSIEESKARELLESIKPKAGK